MRRNSAGRCDGARADAARLHHRHDAGRRDRRRPRTSATPRQETASASHRAISMAAAISRRGARRTRPGKPPLRGLEAAPGGVWTVRDPGRPATRVDPTFGHRETRAIPERPLCIPKGARGSTGSRGGLSSTGPVNRVRAACRIHETSCVGRAVGSNPRREHTRAAHCPACTELGSAATSREPTS